MNVAIHAHPHSKDRDHQDRVTFRVRHMECLEENQFCNTASPRSGFSHMASPAGTMQCIRRRIHILLCYWALLSWSGRTIDHRQLIPASRQLSSAQ